MKSLEQFTTNDLLAEIARRRESERLRAKSPEDIAEVLHIWSSPVTFWEFHADRLPDKIVRYGHLVAVAAHLRKSIPTFNVFAEPFDYQTHADLLHRIPNVTVRHDEVELTPSVEHGSVGLQLSFFQEKPIRIWNPDAFSSALSHWALSAKVPFNYSISFDAEHEELTIHW